MAQFTHSLCEEVIRTNGKCGLTMNETVQMAKLALRALKNENPLLLDAMRYRWLREAAADVDMSNLLRDGGAEMDANIDARMGGSSGPQHGEGGK